jgi:transposase
MTMDARQDRAICIAAMARLDRTADGVWLVPSQTSPERKYTVNLAKETCTCPDCTESGFVCKHLRAVKIVLKRELGMDGQITETKTFTVTEKKTYAQNWPLYNLAQSIEKDRFQTLLHELCQGIKEPPAPPLGGREPIPLRDKLFALVWKVYGTLSARRSACDMEEARGKGYLSRRIHPNKLPTFFENNCCTGALYALLKESSRPLAAIETDFAVDSTGFSAARNVRWVDEKYGKERSGRDWVKVHVSVGRLTQIVTAAAIYGRDTADSPVLPELVKATRETFSMKEVSADKAYLSQENVEAITAAGAEPYIAFKSNSTGGAGGLFGKMFHFYSMNKDTYMAHYHKRSLVESAFSMCKRKFGDYIRSRTDVAMKNEALAKLVAHNICCLIMSQVELGIEPVFWKEAMVSAPVESPAPVAAPLALPAPAPRQVRRMSAIVGFSG